MRLLAKTAKDLGKSAWGLFSGILASLRNAPGRGWTGTVSIIGLVAGEAINVLVANKGHSGSALPQDGPY